MCACPFEDVGLAAHSGGCRVQRRSLEPLNRGRLGDRVHALLRQNEGCVRPSNREGIVVRVRTVALLQSKDVVAVADDPSPQHIAPPTFVEAMTPDRFVIRI